MAGSTAPAATHTSKKWTRCWAARTFWPRGRSPAHAGRRGERDARCDTLTVASKTCCVWPSRAGKPRDARCNPLKTSLFSRPERSTCAAADTAQGQIRIRRGEFTSDTVQDKIDELSRRGRGEPENEDVSNVLPISAGIRPQNGRLDLPKFQFAWRAHGSHWGPMG